MSVMDKIRIAGHKRNGRSKKNSSERVDQIIIKKFGHVGSMDEEVLPERIYKAKVDEWNKHRGRWLGSIIKA